METQTNKEKESNLSSRAFKLLIRVIVLSVLAVTFVAGNVLGGIGIIFAALFPFIIGIDAIVAIYGIIVSCLDFKRFKSKKLLTPAIVSILFVFSILTLVASIFLGALSINSYLDNKRVEDKHTQDFTNFDNLPVHKIESISWNGQNCFFEMQVVGERPVDFYLPDVTFTKTSCDDISKKLTGQEVVLKNFNSFESNNKFQMYYNGELIK